MSDDQVKRYQLDYHHTQTYAEMVEDCDGDWVKYNDYKAASDRIEELEAKLAKTVITLKLLVDVSVMMQSATSHNKHRHNTVITDTMWAQWSKQLKYTRTALAELSKERSDEKGQDDE